jgi:two-component system, OmpR family, phosphate regulon sensor histidine kinase PhoR
MMKQKNAILLTLMASSILLLIVLQVFWIRSAYRDAFNDLKKESGELFRTTIVGMYDSLIQRNITVEGDSGMVKRTKTKFRINGLPPFALEGDSVMGYRTFERAESRVEVIFNSDRDSLNEYLHPLMRRMQGQRRPAKFIIRLGPDSLKKDSIGLLYTSRLRNAQIDIPFKVYSVRMDTAEHVRIQKSDLVSEWVRVNPMHQYAVAFADIDGFLIKKITPQILFSFFLSLLTFAAFYILYKNLMAQQKLMQIKNDFISNVTHELKTPVATVSVAIEALRSFNALDDRRKTEEYLDIAKNELDRLTLMTDKILKTSVFESQGVVIQNEPVDMDLLANHVIKSLKLIFNSRKITCVYEKSGDDFVVHGSNTHLTNVLYNLTDNALKYSGDGSSIRIAVRENETSVMLSVKDNGIGIPAEYQKRIFEKFFRVPSGDVHNVKGYGLGLSYVASVIELHHGTIRVESSEGIGSEFILTLPKAKDED